MNCQKILDASFRPCYYLFKLVMVPGRGNVSDCHPPPSNEITYFLNLGTPGRLLNRVLLKHFRHMPQQSQQLGFERLLQYHTALKESTQMEGYQYKTYSISH
jgi:hypothetical protein